MAKIIDKAREQAEEAYRRPAYSASDFADLACPKRVQILDKIVARVGQKRGQIVFDQMRLGEKMRVLIIARRTGWREEIRDIAHAQDLLMAAQDVYDRRLREARNLRGWARSSCKRGR